MNKRYNLCKKETYTVNNEEKTYWHKVGTMFIKEVNGQDQISIKIPDGIAVSGWLSAFPPRENQGPGPGTNQPPRPQVRQPQPNGFSMPSAPEDDLAF